ncbi:hypothetical protein [Pilimelia anulata]|uniref:hypothetical protein n=1 Tax=Pilimelia anulata TaxID=53371 RepID=UPI0016631380|nr:hypothetical protein [Pilimelia anulata]
MTSPEQPAPVEPVIEIEPDTPTDPTPLAPERRRRGRFVAVGAAAVAVALLAGGGTFAVAAWNRALGRQPADALPASVFAFAQLDLRPGLGQRVAGDALVRRAGAAGSPVDLLRELRSPLAEMLDLKDTKLHTWWEGRAGTAKWTHGGQLVTLAAVASADDARTRAALSAVRDARAKGKGSKLGFVLADGYAVIAVADRTDSQAAAEAAVAEARAASLADDAGYRGAVRRLPADRLAVGWADLDRVRTAPPALLAELTPGLSPGEVEKYLHGVVVAAATAADGALEVRSRLIGGTLPRSDAPAARGWLDDTPGRPAQATAAELPGGFGVDTLMLDSAAFMLLPAPSGDAAGGGDYEEVAAGVFERHERDMRAGRAGIDSVNSVGPGSGATVDVRMVDAAAARRLGAAATRAFGRGAVVRVAGDRVSVTGAGRRAAGSRLGDDPTYRRALAGVPASAEVATFMGEQMWDSAAEAAGGDFRPTRAIEAVGAGYWYDGADTVGLARVLVG